MLFICHLTNRAKDSVKHFHVTRKDNAYVFGFNKFSTLQDFVYHFANQPLLGSDTGMQNFRSSLTSTLNFIASYSNNIHCSEGPLSGSVLS